MEFKNFGKYTILKKLATGGMADIFLSISLSPTGFGRFVVIKRALSRFSNSSEFKNMFKNEAKVVCNLKHKNIIPIYEFGIEKDQLFLVMEYIIGSNLRELTKRLKSKSKILSLPNAVYIVKEVAAGLNYAHNAIDHNSGLPLNIIHRDVSPQNVMLSFDGEIKLIDFGIAKISDANLTKAGHLKGKFSYMSPEQAEGKDLDPRTDIFCLGIILWELLTGKRLFASSNELASLKKVRNCDVPNAQKINPSIPTELNNILKKALEKNKNLRYKTAADFEQSLNFFLNKNYPEFSQYDFITFMKTIYRTRIMSEREILKTYSSDFKKYINSLNLEKTLKQSFVLDIPDIGKSYKKEEAQNTETQNLSETRKDSLVSQNIESSLPLQGEASKTENQADQSTIVKSEFLDTEESFFATAALNSKSGSALDNKSKNTETSFKERKTPPALKAMAPSLENRDKPKLKLVTENNPTVSSRFSKSRMSLYSKDTVLKEEKEHPLIRKLQFFGIALCAGALVLGGAYFFTDFNGFLKPILGALPGVTQNVKAPVLAPSPIEAPSKGLTAVREPVSVPQTLKRVYITSRPSNAKIYINGSFISKYTPVLLELNLNSVKSVTLKKSGYLSKTVSISSSQRQIEVFLDKKANRGGGHKIEIIK